MDITNEKRLELEMTVLQKVIEDALAQGFHCRVWDGEAWATDITIDQAVLIDALRSTDQDEVHFYVPSLIEGKKWKNVGWVQFTYGNMPYEVISNYTDDATMAAILNGADALQDKLCEELT